MATWGYIVIALLIFIFICLVFLLILIEVGAKGLSAFFGIGSSIGRGLIKEWRKAEELELTVASKIISHDPRLEVLKTKVLFQGEFKGKLPFLKFFKKDVSAYVVYPVEVRYYAPLVKKAHFEKIDDDSYGGLDKVALQVADIEVEISEPGFAESKLFIDIDSGKIGKDEKHEILARCWKAINSGMKDGGLPHSLEQNRGVARNMAVTVIQNLLRGLGVEQPVEIEFYDTKKNRPVLFSRRERTLELAERTYQLKESDFSDN